MRTRSWLVGMLLLFAGAQAPGQDIAVSSQKLNDHLYRIASNVYGTTTCVASIGPDGVLLVDTGVPQSAASLKDRLEKLGGKKISIIINTHTHADHIGGNALLGHGATIYAHAKARAELTSGNSVLLDLPEEALPNKPVSGPMSLHFNGEDVKIIPVPDCHSDTDLVVYFAGSKVACLGGLGNPARFPSWDTGNGGTFAAFAPAVEKLLKELPAETVLIPGHSENSTMAALKTFDEMLLKTSAIVKKALADGKDVKTLQSKELFKEWESYGQGFMTQDRYLNALVAEFTTKPVPPKKSLMPPLHRALKEKGVEGVVAQYRELKAKEPDAYGFGENVLNTFGYYLMLNKNRLVDAIVIFKLNVEEYPSSFNPYDSLGEAYAKNRQLDLAIQSYQKALEINPGFDNAKTELQKLMKQKDVVNQFSIKN